MTDYEKYAEMAVRVHREYLEVMEQAEALKALRDSYLQKAVPDDRKSVKREGFIIKRSTTVEWDWYKFKRLCPDQADNIMQSKMAQYVPKATKKDMEGALDEMVSSGSMTAAQKGEIIDSISEKGRESWSISAEPARKGVQE